MSLKRLTAFVAFSLFQVCFLGAQTGQKVAIKLVDDKGVPVENAQVAAILKSGAYQDALWDQASGFYKCEPTVQCIKVFAAAVGYEATVAKFPRDGGLFPMALKKSLTKNSSVIRRSGVLPGVDGSVNPYLDSSGRTGIYTTKIGLESRGRPALQPLYFVINKPIEAVSSTGRPFKIWVVDITQEVSILEYTLPK
jgi:hypothetical protein